MRFLNFQTLCNADAIFVDVKGLQSYKDQREGKKKILKNNNKSAVIPVILHA